MVLLTSQGFSDVLEMEYEFFVRACKIMQEKAVLEHKMHVMAVYEAIGLFFAKESDRKKFFEETSIGKNR